MMRALSLWQPWASLLSIEAKKIETRSYRTSFRGEFAIHASKRKMPIEDRDLILLNESFRRALTDAKIIPASRKVFDPTTYLPTSVILAVADLDSTIQMGSTRLFDSAEFEPSEDSDERAFGLYEPGRWMWFIKNVRRLREPVSCSGMLGFWKVPEAIEREVRRQL